MQHNPDQEKIKERIENSKEIEQMLLSFKDVKGINFHSNRLSYANRVVQVVKFRKSDLEIAKSNLEDALDRFRIWIAILLLLITFFIVWIPVSLPYKEWREWSPYLVIIVLLLLIYKIFEKYKDLDRQLARLHIIKIAIALKSEIKNNNVEGTSDLSN